MINDDSGKEVLTASEATIIVIEAEASVIYLVVATGKFLVDVVVRIIPDELSQEVSSSVTSNLPE